MLQHAQRENKGYIFEYAKDRKIDVDVVELWNTTEFPDATEYDGVVILGGTMNVHDDFPFLKAEIEFIKKYIHKVPMLGICLGAQLLAHTLGADIQEDSEGQEVGFGAVTLTDKGCNHPLFHGFLKTIPVLQWHGQTFTLPEGADLLASSEVCKNQAFAYKNVYGIQFHFEITPALGREFHDEGRDWARKHDGFNDEEFLEELDRSELIIKMQCYQLFDNFLKGTHII